MRVAETGLTMAEYFRDEDTQKCLLILLDNIFRFTQRDRKCLRFLEECRRRRISAVRLLRKMENCREESQSTKNGSVTLRTGEY